MVLRTLVAIGLAHGVGRNVRRRNSRVPIGTTNIDSCGAVITPPTIGAAMRCMISDPFLRMGALIPRRAYCTGSAPRAIAEGP